MENKNSKKSLMKKLNIVLGASIVLGSVLPIPNIALANGTNSVERISGQNRYKTSESILKSVKTDYIFLIDGSNYPDALSVGSISYVKDIPVFLSKGDIKEIDFLKSQGIKKITIVGGEKSVSKEFEKN